MNLQRIAQSAKTIYLLTFSLIMVLLAPRLNAQNKRITWQTDSIQIKKIYSEELQSGKAFAMLTSLCTQVGGRLSGSPQAAKAVEWALAKMKATGMDTVYTQKIMVPHWVRGPQESAFIVMGGRRVPLAITALGGSIATPLTGLSGQLVEILSFEELAKMPPDKIKGKIVFFNRPFDQRLINTGDAYGGAVDQRSRGAIEAAKYGAIGSIVRSMSSVTDNYPHTGYMGYSSTVIKIPAAALSTEAADLVTRALKEDAHLIFTFRQQCELLPDAPSFNVIGEMRGKMYPNEVIAVGGHLDSWDLAQGAQDDGAGIVQSLEVAHLFKALGIQPLHTLRIVFFMNEENGSRGALQYAALAKASGQTHLAALESDEGGFTPRGFNIAAGPLVKATISQWSSLFEPFGSSAFSYSDQVGADIEPLKNLSKVLIGLSPDPQRYFDIHHTSMDVISQVNQRELKLGAASIASLVYLIDQHGL